MRSFSLKLATEYRDDLHQIFNQFLLLAFPISVMISNGFPYAYR